MFLSQIFYSIFPHEENVEMAVVFPVSFSRALIISASKDWDYHHCPKALFRNTQHNISKTFKPTHPLPSSHFREE